MAIIFAGLKEAQKIKDILKRQLSQQKKPLKMKVVIVGIDPINKNYLDQLQKVGSDLGIELQAVNLDSQTNFPVMKAFLEGQNSKNDFDGLLVQVSSKALLFDRREEIVDLVAPEKDVDYLGSRFFKDRRHVPSVCQAVILAIGQAGQALSFVPGWVKVLVVGVQGFWGRRIKRTLKSQGFDYLGGIDKETANLAPLFREVDVVISCVGQPKLIKEEMIKKGAAVIDVGFSQHGDLVVGDVDFASVKKKAGFITPVPGGIGPLSTVLVFKNLLDRLS